MTERLGDGRAQDERVRFLAQVAPFSSLDAAELARVAASVTRRPVAAGEAVLIEGGPPGTHLFVVREGTMELTRTDVLVTMVSGGDVFGHPTLLTGLPPEFTVQARSDTTLYCIPRDVALEMLSHPDGVRWLAANHRERLMQAARSMSALPEARTLPVTAVIRSTPLFCDPGTSIHDAAEIMAAGGRSAILVRTREGLGIVTDVDIRDKVVIGGVSREAAVSTIMSTPVHTIGHEALAPEAGIAMMATGVNHLPVLDADGTVLGILSASNLMTLEARSPFALRRSLQWARDEEELVAAAGDVPKLFLDLLDAHLDPPSLTRVLTVLADAITARLLELAAERHGEPPVPYAWLAFGSAARSELTLASDQDNGLAYADTDDPAVDDYFKLVAAGRQPRPRTLRLPRRPPRGARQHPAVAHDAQRMAGRLRVLPGGPRPRQAGTGERVLRLSPGGRGAVRRPGSHRHHAPGAGPPALSARPRATGHGDPPAARVHAAA